MARLRSIFLSLHLALFASILLSMFLKMLVIREIIGFLYLTFIPGFVLISMFRLKLNLTETVLYSVGASLSIVMFLGLVVNQFYAFVGVKRPLSLVPILVAMSAVTLLCSFRVNGSVKIKSERLTFILSLMLLPFLSVFGSYLFNMYDINLLNLFVILLISSVPILITFKKIPQNYIPFTIYIVSFSILYNVCLVSAYLWGWDIHHLYYWTLITRQNLYWKPSEYPLLITTIVPTIYSVMTGINLVWFYKIMFPFFVTLIPLGIYEVCRKEFNEWYIPTLAPFSFMFYYWFYKTFPVKQIPSELFLILIIGLLVDDNLPNFGRMALLTLFSFGLTVSHYGVCYFFMIVLLLMLILHILKFGTKQSFVKLNFVAIYIVLIIGWYMFVYNSYKFNQIADIGYNILTNLINLINSPPSRSGVGYLKHSTPTLIWKLYKYINALFVVFLSTGVLQLLYSFMKGKLSCKTHTFAFISIGAFSFLLSSIVVTYSMGFDRTLQVTLSILAPYVIIGFVCLAKMFNSLVKVLDLNINNIIELFGIFIVVYFLFNSGFMFYITGSKLPPYCISLNKKCWQSWRAFYLSEVCGVLWLKNHCVKTIFTLHTKISSVISEFYKYGNYHILSYNNYFLKHILPNTYMYLSTVDKKLEVYSNYLSKVYTSGYGECYVS